MEYFEKSFKISGNSRLSFVKNGSFYDVDQGVEPDIALTRLSSFYNREFVAEELQLGVRKDIQTVNKRVLLAAATGDADIIAEQRSDFEERFPSLQNSGNS